MEGGSRTHHLLDAALLERRELGGTRLHVQLAAALVLLAHLADARVERRHLAALDVLEDLGAARVARVGVDLEERLDLGHARDDAAHRDQLAEVGAADLADGENGLVGERAEVQVAAEGERVSEGDEGREEEKEDERARDALAAQQLGREHGLAGLLVLRVLVVAVVLHDVEDVRLGANVDRLGRHDLVDGAAEQLDVALRVALNLPDKRASRLALLRVRE